VSGVPPMGVPRFDGSKTQTSARPTLGVVSCGSMPVFWPRCAVVTKARLLFVKTTSRGSSPTSSVRLTNASCGTVTSTMLTLSDRWLTTHTSLSDRTATAIGSRPTATEPAGEIRSPSIRKISSRLSGVFTA
jgi:hypothetical protein